MQVPQATDSQFGGVDTSYDASRGWDAGTLVNPPASAAMALDHTALVQQPLPADELPAEES